MRTILDLLAEDGVVAVLKGSKHGGEYHSPCPGCGGRDRFVCWPEASGGMGGGRFWCRGATSPAGGKGCDCQGDAVQYLRDFRGMSFPEALEYLGVPADHTAQRRPAPRPVQSPAWEPREEQAPPELWRVKGAAFVAHCEEELRNRPQVLEWLHDRGLTEATVRARRLGFHDQLAFRPLSAWGLSAPVRQDGKIPKLALLPGLVIPDFEGAELHKLKIREFECAPWPEWATGDKYREVKGSNQRYSIYGQGRDLAIVVETELDAMLLAERVGDLAMCMATGSAQRKPDAAAALLLKSAKLVLNALDSDDAGAKAAWSWWDKHLPGVKRWPVPKRLGKDPGDLVKAGVDVRQWALAGVRRHAPALLAASAPLAASDVQVAAIPAAAPVQPVQERPRAANAWPVPEGVALADMTLPPRAPAVPDLVRALQARPLDAPGCLVPCPRTRPPFWWTYFTGCEGCAGHPQCLLDLVRSQQFQEALNGQA